MPVEDVLNFIETKLAQLPAPGDEEIAVQSGIPISRYVAGLTGEQELRGELSGLGHKGLKLERLITAAQLKRELALYQERLDRYTKQLQKNLITPSQFTSFLESWGVPNTTIPLELSKAQEDTPAVTLRSVQVTLRLVQVEEIPARPAEAPISIGLSIRQAEAVSAPVTGVQPLSVSLSIIQHEAEVISPTIKPVELLMDIIGVKEE